jgi:hypothetical protein
MLILTTEIEWRLRNSVYDTEINIINILDYVLILSVYIVSGGIIVAE